MQVTGFVERDGSQLAFHPMQWWLYVKFESAYLRCEAVNQWFLQLDIVERIGPQFEVEAEDFCVTSIGGLSLFNSGIGYKISAFSYLADKECAPQNGKVKTAGFLLENGETIYFDPSANDGFRVGSKEQVFKWTSELHCPMQNFKEELWAF